MPGPVIAICCEADIHNAVQQEQPWALKLPSRIEHNRAAAAP